MQSFIVVSREALAKIKELTESLDLDDKIGNEIEFEDTQSNEIEEWGAGDVQESSDECQPGSYEPVIGDCSSYLSCGQDGKKQKQECSAGLHWVQSKHTCDWKELSGCDAAKPRKSYGECNEGEYSPWPGNCGKYRRCVHKKYQEFSCQSGTHWNNQLRICDHPANAGCSGSGSSSSNKKLVAFR